MALGLAPAVAGGDHSPNSRFARRRALYAAGSLAGGAGMALTAHLVLGAFASPSAWWVAATGLATLYAVPSVVGHQLPVPGRRWQVPQQWYARLGDLAFAPYGAVLGASVFTPIVFPTFYVMMLLLGAAPTLFVVLAGMLYGGLRALLAARPSKTLMIDNARVVARHDHARRAVPISLALVAILGAVSIWA